MCAQAFRAPKIILFGVKLLLRRGAVGRVGFSWWRAPLRGGEFCLMVELMRADERPFQWPALRSPACIGHAAYEDVFYERRKPQT